MIFLTASSPSLILRQASTTLAPNFANTLVASKPIPLLAPVMITYLPAARSPYKSAIWLEVVFHDKTCGEALFPITLVLVYTDPTENLLSRGRSKANLGHNKQQVNKMKMCASMFRCVKHRQMSKQILLRLYELKLKLIALSLEYTF